eukprot:6823926-Alexandrium_andersonii.AAC.1
MRWASAQVCGVPAFTCDRQSSADSLHDVCDGLGLYLLVWRAWRARAVRPHVPARQPVPTAC